MTATTATVLFVRLANENRRGIADARFDWDGATCAGRWHLRDSATKRLRQRHATDRQRAWAYEILRRSHEG